MISMLGTGRCRGIVGCRRRRSGRSLGAEGGDGIEQLAAMADRGHAQADQVVGRQLR